MNIISLLLMLSFNFPMDSKKIDFPLPENQSWMIVNDDVMGGRSSAKAINQNRTVLFSGNLSLENNGGFASYRSPWAEMDLSQFEGIEIRVRGDGRTYGFSLNSDQRWWRPNHKFTFSSSSGQWLTIKMPLTEFDLIQVGERVRRGSLPMEFKNIIRMGFILSDKQPGAFEMEIDYVDFY